MTRFPGLEAKILRTLEEEGEMRPPAGRLGQEWFWQAATQLQARGLVVADQLAGVVKKLDADLQEVEAPLPTAEVLDLMAALKASLAPSRHGSELPPVPEALKPRPARDLRSRCELLVQRWRQNAEARGGGEGSVYLQVAIDLEEVLEETAETERAKGARR